ncbi:MAG TPA: beta-galactosidase trimerization domain-containing protein, partial [Planctomycetota bacterium]|nr:beta-galactosidase trimerization domain-containing protein [Planctomycetota bacterium]
IDGVFLDGPGGLACYCDACRTAFRKQFGITLPEDMSQATPEVRLQAQEYVHLRQKRYIDAFIAAVRHRKRDVAVYFNGPGLGRPMGAHRVASASCDLVGAEGGFIGYTPLRGQFRYKPGATAKVLEATSPDKPRVIFIDHAFKRYDYHPLTESEIRLMYAGTLANGAWPWYLLYWCNIEGRAGRAGADMNRFITDNGRLLAGSKSLASVALMQSDASLLLPGLVKEEAADDIHKTGQASRLRSGQAASREPLGDHHAEFLGLYEALTRSQAPFDVVDEKIVREGLPGRCTLLVLPNCAAMDDATVAGVRAFVQRGGCVLATFNAATADALGRSRKGPALADVLGIKSLGPVYGPTTLDYLHLEPGGMLAAGITEPTPPCPTLSRAIVPADGAKVLAKYYGRLSGRYVRLPGVSDDAAAVLNTFGRGRAVTVASNIGEHYHAYAFGEHRKMIANVVRELATSPVTVEGAGEFLEVSLRRAAGGETVLHLLNHAGVERPYESILPLGGLRFVVKTDAEVTEIRATRACVDVPFDREGDAVTFTLDLDSEYEMLVIR